MKNFSNPELKKSSIMLIIVAILFITTMNIVITFNFNSIKNSYIDGMAAMIGVITEEYPQLEGELVSNAFMTPSSEDIQSGKDILKDYGYEKSLHIRFMGNINKVFINSKWILVFMGLGFCGLLLILNYFQYRKVYSRIRNLKNVSKEILEENYDMNIYEEKEGDFAKLSYGFKNMRNVIKSQMIDLKREKEFLVNILSDISHQLKTPLSALVVYNDILSREGISKEDKNKFLNSSKNQLERMNWLIKSMLKLAKVDARAIEFNIKENNLVTTVNQVIDSLGVMAKENNVDITFKFSNDTVDKAHINENLGDDRNLYSDVVGKNLEYEWKSYLVKNMGSEKFTFKYDNYWLGEALINIIKNGIEHSGDGKIEILLEENPINTKIIIRDNGEGISEKDLPNIFKRFYKSGKADSVGIGLSLSKSIIESQNGYIEVKSEAGVGTEFRVVLIK